MLDLPQIIDADVVIEIDRMLNDRSKTAPVPVHQLAEMIRTRTGLPALSPRPHRWASRQAVRPRRGGEGAYGQVD